MDHSTDPCCTMEVTCIAFNMLIQISEHFVTPLYCCHQHGLLAVHVGSERVSFCAILQITLTTPTLFMQTGVKCYDVDLHYLCESVLSCSMLFISRKITKSSKLVLLLKYKQHCANISKDYIAIVCKPKDTTLHMVLNVSHTLLQHCMFRLFVKMVPVSHCKLLIQV